MRRLVAEPARRDITRVLEWSRERYGAAARRRYERLITRALVAITAARDPVGSRSLDEVATGVRIYHLRNSRRERSSLRVAAPRHLLVYERPEPDLVIVLRLLHDAMDLPSHLQDMP